MTHIVESMCQVLEEIWESAQKMESRINALETILDDQAPDWRRRV